MVPVEVYQGYKKILVLSGVGAVQWPSKIVYLNSGVKCPLMAASLTGRCTASLTGDGSKLVEGGHITDFIENREQGRESLPGL